MRERIAAGDHVMLDGALATLAASGVPLDAVTFRCLPSDAEAIAASLGDLLADQRGGVGCLCRSELLARGAAAAAAALGMTGRRRPAIVVADASHRLTNGASYPCVEPTMPPQEWGAALGRMLQTVALGQCPEPYRLVIPVRLWKPGRGGL